jgi:hypothetical protein
MYNMQSVKSLCLVAKYQELIKNTHSFVLASGVNIMITILGNLGGGVGDGLISCILSQRNSIFLPFFGRKYCQNQIIDSYLETDLDCAAGQDLRPVVHLGLILFKVHCKILLPRSFAGTTLNFRITNFRLTNFRTTFVRKT